MPGGLPPVVPPDDDDPGTLSEELLGPDSGDDALDTKLAELRATDNAEHGAAYEDFRLQVLKASAEEAAKTGEPYKGDAGHL